IQLLPTCSLRSHLEISGCWTRSGPSQAQPGLEQRLYLSILIAQWTAWRGSDFASVVQVLRGGRRLTTTAPLPPPATLSRSAAGRVRQWHLFAWTRDLREPTELQTASVGAPRSRQSGAHARAGGSRQPPRRAAAGACWSGHRQDDDDRRGCRRLHRRRGAGGRRPRAHVLAPRGGGPETPDRGAPRTVRGDAARDDVPRVLLLGREALVRPRAVRSGAAAADGAGAGVPRTGGARGAIGERLATGVRTRVRHPGVRRRGARRARGGASARPRRRRAPNVRTGRGPTAVGVTRRLLRRIPRRSRAGAGPRLRRARPS